MEQTLADITIKMYAPGETIVHHGRPGNFLAIILEGEVDVVKTDQSGGKRILRKIGDRECFGEMSLVTGELTSADVVASRECRIATIPADTFSETVANNPDAIRYLAQLMSRKLMQDDARMREQVHLSENMTHVASHELKSPLASIATLAMAVLEPDVPMEQKENFLQRIISKAMGAKAMIEEHLALSAIGADGVKIAPERVNLYREVIENVMDHQREIMADKEMSAKVDVPEELEVVCDPKYIQIVYNNLVSNAAKYGDRGTEIYLGFAQLQDGYQHFNVANVGEWIKVDDRKRIFQKFVTLGRRGTGIGLHTTREIVKKHGGDIWVEPCYLAAGRCIAEKDVIEENMAAEDLSTGNSFVFTIPAK